MHDPAEARTEYERMSHRGANSGNVLTSPMVSFAFFAESFANFAVKDFDLGSRLNKDEILNRKDRKGVPQRTQSPLNYDTTEIPLSARMASRSNWNRSSREAAPE